MRKLIKKNIQRLESEFPIIISKNFLSKKICQEISDEINKYNSYDDIVMGGRKRLNKGTKNFKHFINHSKSSKKLFNSFNNKTFFYKIINIFNKTFLYKGLDFFKNNFNYSKINYGLQIGKKLSKYKYLKPTINLDMDFSVAEKGYYRHPHRDRDTRIINFLIYLNTLKKNSGANLEIYKVKKNLKKYPRFPHKKNLILTKKLPPKRGMIILFVSQPNSYHAVSKLKTNEKRYFIYGSYSLDREIDWKKISLTNIS